MTTFYLQRRKKMGFTSEKTDSTNEIFLSLEKKKYMFLPELVLPVKTRIQPMKLFIFKE